MTTARLLPIEVIKEVRAILVVWLGCLAVLLASLVGYYYRLLHYSFLDMGFVVIGLGTIGLGTLSIGHEYTNRTLPALLSLPVGRGRLLLVKLGVLATMVATLGFAVWASLEFVAAPPRIKLYDQSMIPIAIASGLFIAPWFTMLTRSPLAGLVLTLAIMTGWWFAGDMLGLARHGGLRPDDVARVRSGVLMWGTSVTSLCAAALGWRQFIRLEAFDTTEAEIQVPTLGRREGESRRSHVSPVRLLFQKELRLQFLAFIVVGIYALAWLGISIANRNVFLQEDEALQFITFIYLAILSILIGALSSAEERHMGTLEWHLLLPMAQWKQWCIKAGTAFLLAIGLGVGLPGLLSYIDSPPQYRSIFVPEIVVVPVFLTACGLYVSSLARGGLAALLAAIPAIAGGLMLSSVVWVIVQRQLWLSTARHGIHFIAPHVSPILGYAVALGFAGLLVCLAYLNHRNIDRSFTRIWQQVFCMAVFLFASLIGIVWIVSPDV